MDTIWSGRFGEQGEFTSNTHTLLTCQIVKLCDKRTMWQLQSHHVALDHSRKDMWWWGYRDARLHRDGRDTEAFTGQGDTLTWLKLRSTTVPAHRTWDWGPAVFMSCRFCSRILGKKIKKKLKSLRHKLPRSRRNRPVRYLIPHF